MSISSEITRIKTNIANAYTVCGIKAVPLVGGLPDTFRNHCISFALSLGITIDEINAFRAACIDGTPDVVTVNLASYSVTKSGGNIIYSNTDSSVTQFQGYETELTPDTGYVIESVNVTMGTIHNHNTDGDVFVIQITVAGYFRQAMLISELNTESLRNAVIITKNEVIN